MNIQEIEEANYYPQTEAQMCFEEASIACGVENADASVEIVKALRNGRFVVVAEAPRHDASDAIVGFVRYYVADFATRGEAEAAQQQYYVDNRMDLGDGENVFVLPAAPAPVVVAQDDDGEGVPF